VKRLLRITLITIILLSFLLFMSSIFMWVRSYYVEDGVTHTHRINSHDVPLRRVISLDSGRGDLGIGVGHMTTPLFDFLGSKPAFAPYPPRHMVWSHLGFSHHRLTYRNMLDMWFLDIPFWFLTLVFATPPSLWLMKRVRRKPKSPNICPACGYDLRATPSRCPECGTSRKNIDDEILSAEKAK
jgi:hypothetical protein